MNIKAAGLIAIFAILITSPVLAVDASPTAKPTLKPRVESRTQKMALLEQRKLTEASKTAMFRQKYDTMRLKIASHEAQIRLKIQTFKNKQKAEIAERINANLNKINQNQTNQMLRHLDKMTLLLDKLEERVNSNSPDIKDSTLATEAIADARKAIDAAKAAAEEQALKDYTINVTTETNIRVDAQIQRDKLRKDIQTTRKLVIDAKQAVSNAIRVAKSGKIATPSAQIREGTPSGQQ